MNTFINEHFLLDSESAKRLYHDFAKDLPIIDYHNHLPVNEIADNKQFENLSQIWLHGDHYKWRAMRTNGVSEEFITGSRSDREKFHAWAKTVPHTLRNPLYHWTHLELNRYFGISDLLNAENADQVYETANTQLKQDSHRVQNLLLNRNVEVVCTTDDPIDSLEFHQKIAKSDTKLTVLPAFRPDKAMDIQSPSYLNYLEQLGNAAGIQIQSLDDLLQALQLRHDFFHENGCRLSDHGLQFIDSFDAQKENPELIFKRVLDKKLISTEEIGQVRGYLLLEMAKMDHAKSWTQQYHLGAIRNNSSRMFNSLGADTGFDSIGDFSHSKRLAKFLNQLDSEDKLTKTILYNLNPADNEVFATMCGNFNDGSIRGKMQWGSAWWFLDQLDGMTKQINALSNMGMLSTFVGMLTDSRSFLSFPRHEYFRRLLCNLIGTDMEKGLIPMDFDLAGTLVKKVCYQNAKEYFGFTA